VTERRDTFVKAQRTETSTFSRVLFAILRRSVIALSAPILLSEYFHSETGKEYGVGFWTKLKLAIRMERNRKKVITGSHYLEHLLMATEILKVPRSLEGCVVECGSFKGGSATNLSLVCALCDRKLEIFDSFQGLPEPSDLDRRHHLVSVNELHTYAKGAWHGTLDEVKANISRYGNIGVCNFNVGYFDDTLPHFQKRCVLAFLDVDLTNSLRACLRHLWPLLLDGSYLFTHEAPHQEISAAFFDQEWWHANIDSDAPGLVGAGSGIGLFPSKGGFRSDLGFTVKHPNADRFRLNPQTGVRDQVVSSKPA
jgi:O-methyltransferase